MTEGAAPHPAPDLPLRLASLATSPVNGGGVQCAGFREPLRQIARQTRRVATTNCSPACGGAGVARSAMTEGAAPHPAPDLPLRLASLATSPVNGGGVQC